MRPTRQVHKPLLIESARARAPAKRRLTIKTCRCPTALPATKNRHRLTGIIATLPIPRVGAPMRRQMFAMVSIPKMVAPGRSFLRSAANRVATAVHGQSFFVSKRKTRRRCVLAAPRRQDRGATEVQRVTGRQCEVGGGAAPERHGLAIESRKSPPLPQTRKPAADKRDESAVRMFSSLAP